MIFVIELPEMTFKPLVLTLEENSELKWLGHLLVKRLFDGEHRFCLSDYGDGTTIFEHSENFRGLLVGLFASRLDNDTRRGFEKMNRALKLRAEALSTAVAAAVNRPAS